MVKISRCFFGGYTPDWNVLKSKKYLVVGKTLKVLSVLNNNQGKGKIKGTINKLGDAFPSVSVCVFRRDTRQLLWEIKSQIDGNYEFRNIKSGLECFVIAFDPNNQYNAVIQDKVVAK